MCSFPNMHEVNAYRADHVYLSEWFNLRTTGWISVKFGLGLRPFEAT
jgi:hypothetical protein